ncbi:MAG: hypothetical protein ACOYEG_14085 [Petrimonas sp.]|jgi:hypothetical protein|nr:MAG: hypothetical protein BWZ00_01382 [Bacteroidetes bacterium ADurb.BinA174]
MLTENQLREQLMHKIKQLPADKLRNINNYINFLENSVNESSEEYVADTQTINNEIDEKNLEDWFNHVDYSNREYQPGEKTYTVDEVFDGIMDMMSEYYGMDMRKFSKRYQ